MLNIEEAAAAKLKAEEDAAKEKLDCFLVAGLLYFSASDLLRMGMGTCIYERQLLGGCVVQMEQVIATLICSYRFQACCFKDS